MKRGLFRIWFSLSIFWVVFVAILAWAAWPISQKEFDEIPAQYRENEFDDVFLWAIMGEHYPYTLDDIEFVIQEYTSGRKKAIGHEIELLQRAQNYVQDEMNRQSSEKVKLIQISALSGGLPPLVLLVIGLTVAWIIRGFRMP